MAAHRAGEGPRCRCPRGGGGVRHRVVGPLLHQARHPVHRCHHRGGPVRVRQGHGGAGHRTGEGHRRRHPSHRRAGHRHGARHVDTWPVGLPGPTTCRSPCSGPRATGAGGPSRLPSDHSPWHPELKTGATLTATRTWGDRGHPARPRREGAHADRQGLPGADRPRPGDAGHRQRAREGRRRAEGLPRGQAGGGDQGRQQGADPGHHLPPERLRRAQGRARRAQGRDLPGARAAAGQDAHLRPAAARVVRRRQCRARRQEQGPVCRGRLRRGQRAPGAVRRDPRRDGRGEGHLERGTGHRAVLQGGRGRQGRHDDAVPACAGRCRDCARGHR